MLLLAAPLLLAALVVGLLVGMFQAATQINEMTLSFIPKLLAMTAALALAGPWMLKILISYTRELFESIPTLIRTDRDGDLDHRSELQAWVAMYFWPFLRIAACLMVAPVFGASFVPARIRIVLALALPIAAPLIAAPRAAGRVLDREGC